MQKYLQMGKWKKESCRAHYKQQVILIFRKQSADLRLNSVIDLPTYPQAYLWMKISTKK